MLTTVAGYLLLVMLAAQELRRRKVPILVPGAIRQTLQECPGILTFMGMCNLQSTVRMGNREVDTLVIGASIGLAGAGLYKVVKQFSAVVGMLLDPVFHAVYPEMARMWARGDLRPFQRITVQVMLLSGAVALGIWLAFLVLGRWILEVTVGEAFLPAFPSMVWYLGATVVALFASPLGPALLAAGRPLAAFWMTVLGTVVYFTVLFALLGPLGLVAPGIAALCFYLVWFATMSALLLHALRRARDLSPQRSIDGDWSHTCAPRT
jgi:O-antigen/teichoic acid export membrane protein